MKNLIKKSIFVAVVLFGSFLGTAFGQVQSNDITLSVNPTYPTPNQNASATLGSYSIDLNKTNISWLINGKEAMSGIGRKTFSFTMGDAGSSLVLEARINTIEGQSLVKTITLTSTDVDMLWEAYDAYTPPFYKGKALVPSQGTFKVVAIPNLTTSTGRPNPGNLSYDWTKDNNKQPNFSGWGKSYFIFKNSYLDKNNTVAVVASDISGVSKTSGSITLQTVTPKIIFYKKNPSLGTQWGKAMINGFSINKGGEVLVVEPYFFSPKNISSPELTFDWYFNGEKTQTPSIKNVLPIKPAVGQTGSAKIKVSINNTLTLFQSAEKEVDINF